MKFRIRNVGKVSRADIEADGITVIAGYNNTGKTTILRSVDVILKTYQNLAGNIQNERLKSMRNMLLKQDVLFDKNGFEELSFQLLPDIANAVCDNVVSCGHKLYEKEKFYEIYLEELKKYMGEEDISERHELTHEIPDEIYRNLNKIEKREDAAYEKYLAELNLRNEFYQQASNLKADQPSEISFLNNGSSCVIKFQNDRITEVSGIDLGEAPVIYIETRNILDDINNRRFIAPASDLRKLLVQKRNYDKDQISYEQYQETERNRDVFNDIWKEALGGRLVLESGVLKYKEEESDQMINIRNVASGMKIFLVLQGLIENGSLKENSWILIDEPESNLHPDWHLKIAEILILLKIKMNIHILLISHSPYFMRALEVKMADYGIKDAGKFYLMEEKDGAYAAKDVTKCTEAIYQQLYQPLEML